MSLVALLTYSDYFFDLWIASLGDTPKIGEVGLCG